MNQKKKYNMKKEVRKLVKSILKEVYEEKNFVAEQILKDFLNDKVEIEDIETSFEPGKSMEDGEFYEVGDTHYAKGEFSIFFKTTDCKCNIAGVFDATLTMTSSAEPEVGYGGDGDSDFNADTNYFYSESYGENVTDKDIQLGDEEFIKKISPELIEALDKKISSILEDKLG